MQNKIIIIAEAGINHNGSLKLAKTMIKIAAKCGADYIKFQTYNTNQLVTNYGKISSYQKQGRIIFQRDLLKKYELQEKDYYEIIKTCKKNKIGFLSTPFDESSLNFLLKLKIDYIKIASGEITNWPFLKIIGSKNKKIILSTGMSSYKEIKSAFKILIKNGTSKKNITILHCTSNYPTEYNEVNLNAMLSFKKIIGSNYGLSDHTKGFEIPIAAAALGAKVIEKHFTLDKNMKGPDHKASLDAKSLNLMIKSIRNVELALGSSDKISLKSEFKNRILVRKSLVAKKYIKKGEIFNKNNLTQKRPGNGISPIFINKILGKKAKKNYKQDEQIKI